jgi:hypothetical protein
MNPRLTFVKGKFSVAQTSEPQWNDDAFKALVLEEDMKSFIHDLVSEHRVADGKFDDIIRDKGRGLVGLLAGPPGVGKASSSLMNHSLVGCVEELTPQ